MTNRCIEKGYKEKQAIKENQRVHAS